MIWLNVSVYECVCVCIRDRRYGEMLIVGKFRQEV